MLNHLRPFGKKRGAGLEKLMDMLNCDDVELSCDKEKSSQNIHYDREK